MGRKVSQLIPFLIDALERKKYKNLRFEDPINRTFSLFLPQKSSKLDVSCQLVLKGWFNVRRRRYILDLNYTEAKQCIEAALRKSDFLELVSKGKKQKRVYRFLDQNEILEKKNLKKKEKKTLKLDPYEGSEHVPSPGSSGYGSGSDHVEEVYELEENCNLVQGFNHDHKYIKKSELVIVYDGSPHQENIQSFGKANHTYRTEVLFHNSYNQIVEAPGYSKPSPYLVENIDMEPDQTPIAIERQTCGKEDDRMVTDQTPGMKINIGNETQPYENSFCAKMIDSHEFRNLQLGSLKAAAPHAEKEGIPKMKTCSYWDTLTPSRRTFENPYGNLDLSRPPDNLFSDEEEDPPLQCPEMNFDLPLDNDSPLSDVELNDIFNFVISSENNTMNEEISCPTLPTNLDISSCKTKFVKVYECIRIQNLPGMIMLTCEPKLKEFCTTDVAEIDDSRPQLIFDEATMQLVSKCTIENLQLLSNDYLLVLLKCKEFITEYSMH